MTRADLTDAHTRDVCRIGQGHACCRYLLMGSGWECAKHHPTFGPMLDRRVAADTINAQGDNCEGVSA